MDTPLNTTFVWAFLVLSDTRYAVTNAVSFTFALVSTPSATPWEFVADCPDPEQPVDDPIIMPAVETNWMHWPTMGLLFSSLRVTLIVVLSTPSAFKTARD